VAFYGRWFGFDRVLGEYDDGTTFVTDSSGFELAFHEDQQVARRDRGTWHFGFLAASADVVTRTAAAMRVAGVTVEAFEDAASYVGFKCRDPDGYEIEVYCEPRT
jgi:catechol 2,3-dioxygenase-like lactoylglutathione lyase family enzyme